MPVTKIKSKWSSGNLIFTDNSNTALLSIESDGTVDIKTASKLKVVGAAIEATPAEINRAADLSARIVNLAAATLSVTLALHDGRIITVNRAAGSALTLPAASGSGAHFRIFIGTAVTSNSTTIKVANASDIMAGSIVGAIDGGTTNNFWLTSATSDTITFDGSTTGGYKGDQIELIDVATNLWMVNGLLKQTGTEATPFSATV